MSVGRQIRYCERSTLEAMSTPAIIAIVDFTVNATDRPAALARLGANAGRPIHARLRRLPILPVV